MTFLRPAVERYIRVDVTLPDGGCVDVGLEDTGGDVPLAELALNRCVFRSMDSPGDAREIAERIEAEIREWFPDRYWFAEVWTPGAIDGVKRYQVIQPAVVGGFRK